MNEEPRTATGRRLFTDMDPMDLMESDGVTPEDIAAIEAEAVAPLLALVRSAGDVLAWWDGPADLDSMSDPADPMRAALAALPADILAAARKP